ncbi:MAG: GGDEF domain-containing protein [Thermocrispum sp.]
MRTLGAESRVLRARWRTASIACGWRFPSDWALPEVDAVCAALVTEGPTDSALSGLGRARAAAGAGLDETLSDLAALHAVLAEPDVADGFVAPDVDATPSRLLRVTAMAWAEVAVDQLANTEVTDPLTGLPTAAYLRTRLAEVYRAAGKFRRPVTEHHVLLVVSMDLRELTGWPRLTVMILAADALREVFDGGETVACVGPSTLAVLTERDDDLPSRAVALRRVVNAQLLADRQLHGVSVPGIRLVRLQPTFAESCAQLSALARH